MYDFSSLHNILCYTRINSAFDKKDNPADPLIFAPRGLHILFPYYYANSLLYIVLLVYTHHMNTIEDSQLYRCPCCGYYTLPGSGNYEICPVCFWEDDPIQEDDPALCDGANKVCLNEARDNYEKYGACEERFVPHVRAPYDEEKE